MKNMTLAAAVLLAAIAIPAAADQKVIAEKSSIRFVSKQMGVDVEGRFRKFDGKVSFDAARPEATKAEFEVDLASIDFNNVDTENEAKHLNWFNTAYFPTAKFAATSVKSTGPGKYEATGKLSMKGVTDQVTAPFTFKESGGLQTLEGSFIVKRLVFKIGEGQWADTDTVADNVQVRFKFVLPSGK